jgi:hypothetical protein
MCERWDFRRGFSIDWSRHKTDLKITRKARGLNTKQGVFFLLWIGTYKEGRGLQELLGLSNRQGSRQLGARARRKTDRGERGDLKDVLTTGGDWREAPDLEEGRPAVVLWRHTGGVVLATFHWSSGDEDNRQTCNTTRRSTWQGRLASAMLLCIESGDQHRRQLAALVWPTVTMRRGKARWRRARRGLRRRAL